MPGFAPAPPLPRRLQVEVTASCNLSCRMCIVSYRPRLPRSASMDVDSFKRLVEGLPGLESVVLQGIGEPLLAPGLFDMIRWATGRGIRTEFNSNATLLSPAAGQRLIDSGLDALHISLDGATAETYEFIRQGARFDAVTRNIARFARDAREAGRPELSLVVVLMQRNLPEIPLIVRRAADWGIPEVFVQGLSHDFSDADADAFAAIGEFVRGQHVDGAPRQLVDDAFAAIRAAADETGVRVRLPSPGPADDASGPYDRGCDWPWDGGYIARDGTVLPCCMVMGEGRIAFGNVNDRPYADIWESDDFQRFRAGLEGGDPHPVCRGCAMYRGRF